jgi:Mn2+/Fe2+ NRAMP family transporter
MMSETTSKIEQDREILAAAQAEGRGATLKAWVKLSGPGWLQSAITLGGGSLAGALFLGSLGGVNLLWLQLVAIIMGVVMLSAISYVTLSTGERPFKAINTHINPALGWGWLIATSLANMIWCMPQFSLCFGALEGNLLPQGALDSLKVGGAAEGDSSGWVESSPKLMVSVIILVLVSFVVALNARRGLAAKVFDWVLKGLVGLVVICFFLVVAVLTWKGELDWGAILAGFIPDLNQWNGPSGKVGELVASLPADAQEFWTERIVKQQRARMIGAAATAVGINMTFLMPYALLHRGWDKTFRGLARFDLSTGMAIPYIVVTSCVVIAAAHAFNGTADAQLLSTDPAVFQSSPTFGGTQNNLMARVDPEYAGKKFGDVEKELTPEGQALLIAKMAALPAAEKQIASSMVQRNASDLAKTLAPALGERGASLIFGLGVFGMGFSTIIILMLINGYVFCEAMGKPDGVFPYVLGCLVAGVVGAMWPMFWTGDSKFWLAIVASNFGMMLLPIAYFTFFMMMNSRSLMGSEKPTGGRMLVWNVLMGVSVLGALIAASAAIWEKMNDTSSPNAVMGGRFIVGMVAVYVVLIVLGFVAKRGKQPSEASTEG